MKKLEIIVKPEKLEDLQDILEECKVSGMMVYNLMGYGNQKGMTQVYRGAVYDVNLLAKVKVETVVDDEKAALIKKKVVEGISTGHFGDGKIFEYTVDDVVRIRTGERGEGAV